MGYWGEWAYDQALIEEIETAVEKQRHRKEYIDKILKRIESKKLLTEDVIDQIATAGHVKNKYVEELELIEGILEDLEVALERLQET